MFPGRSIRWKMMFVTMTTALIALVFAGAALLLYDIRSYQLSRLNDLGAQADIVGRASAPALAFADPDAARANLGLLRVRPRILAAALYDDDGAMFARWATSDSDLERIPQTLVEGPYRAGAGEIGLFRPLIDNGRRVGTVFILARDELRQRVAAYIWILVAVLVASLCVALLLSAWLQRAMTKPLLSIADVARRVMEGRDFSLRAPRTTQDEVGVMADAFNDMLVEVEKRAHELETSNRSLHDEMASRRAAEAALRQADRRKDEFLATLAHELRNPLAPLRNGLQILRMKPDDALAREQAQAIMERQLQQMVRLVDDLLDVSRISTGKMVVTRAPLDFRIALQSALDTARPSIEARAHRLDVTLPDSPIPILGDATRLAQVVANLLNNAAKYTRPGGHIRLAARAEGDLARVVVSDNGIGIAPDMLDAIFDMFVQADSSIERVQAGLGVGLTLARRLVEMHEGTIGVTSRGLGEGSEFTITLPLAAESAHIPEERRDVASERRAEERSRRVLVVDDNRDFSSTLEVILRASGHTVAVAHDAPTGVELARTFRPDVALLDIGLPGKSGYELARELRALEETAGIVMIAVTGWGQTRDRERSREAGFDHHLVKPAEPEVIRRIVMSVGGDPDVERAPRHG